MPKNADRDLPKTPASTVAIRMQRKLRVSEIYVPRDETPKIWRTIDTLREGRLLGREPTCLILTGKTGVGKSEVLKRYLACNPAHRASGSIVRPVLLVSVPDRASPKDAAQAVVGALLRPRPEHENLTTEENSLIEKWCRGSKNDVTSTAKSLMGLQRVEVMILDEFQHASERGGAKSQSNTTDWVKHFLKTAGIPVVLAGMPSIEVFVRDHAQLESLTQYSFTLHNFRYDKDADRNRFKGVLRELGSTLPFDTCVPFDDPDIALAFHLVTRGYFRPLTRLIQAAADAAIEEDLDDLTVAHLAVGAHKVFRLIPPEERPEENPFLRLL